MLVSGVCRGSGGTLSMSIVVLRSHHFAGSSAVPEDAYRLASHGDVLPAHIRTNPMQVVDARNLP
jgi:hypothetical protein